MFQIATTLLALGTLTSATVMHVVTVGENGQLAFCPEQITAAAGDLVQFQFYPKVLHLAFSCFANIFQNHTVTQGFFAKGCTPISDAPAGTAQQGIRLRKTQANIKAHFLVSCRFPQTQTPPPSPRSPSQ